MGHLRIMLSWLVAIMSIACARDIDSICWFRMCVWVWVEPSHKVHIMLLLLLEFFGSQKAHWATTNIKPEPLGWVATHDRNDSLVSLVHVCLCSWGEGNFWRPWTTLCQSENILATDAFYGTAWERWGTKASASCSGDSMFLEGEGIKATYFIFRHIFCVFYGVKNPYLARIWAFKISLPDIVSTSWWWTYSSPNA